VLKRRLVQAAWETMEEDKRRENVFVLACLSPPFYEVEKKNK